MKLTIIGASGHGKVVADVAVHCGYDQIQFLDDDGSLTNCGKWPVIGKTNMLVSSDLFVAIGNAQTRKMILERIDPKRVVTLVHPSSVIADGVQIGKGTIVMAGAVINPDSIIGEGCIINTSSSVDHDCIIGDYAHISVGAHLSGSVNVGEMTWIGVGSSISNNISICENCIIGAGTIVINDITVPGTYVGSPARKVK